VDYRNKGIGGRIEEGGGQGGMRCGQVRPREIGGSMEEYRLCFSCVDLMGSDLINQSPTNRERC
jgi:hypothetical protein